MGELPSCTHQPLLAGAPSTHCASFQFTVKVTNQTLRRSTASIASVSKVPKGREREKCHALGVWLGD